MSTGPRYRVHFRRRREGKTDYRVRLRLLKSGTPRAVVRFSGRRVRVSIVQYDPVGDRVVAVAESAELARVGFPASSFSSTPRPTSRRSTPASRRRSSPAPSAPDGASSSKRRPESSGSTCSTPS